ncbi:DUF1611 domain-containing protein [Natronomonas salina]|uniref:DUF1611 domain-containing protein n=1 Tax=Natronomonas salina TaxID=1710540 RepID=UPI0015B5B437|nr:DUF1611 domain-containing protein [Natronomonas salina]QLD90822.1 DUF1611 domain-containing protein [Natronomonas salina]
MRIAILAHEQFPDRAKTAVGVLRYGDQEVVAVLDRDSAGTTVGDHLPDVDADDVPVVEGVEDAPAFDALVIGIAPIGGGFDESWRSDVRGAIEQGADVVSGLHYFLENDAEFRNLADEHGVELRDVRKPPDDLTVADGVARDLDCEIVLTVGTDCSTGKMTTTLELVEAAREAGLDAGFVPTGQTGIVIAGWGVPIDRTISDFTNGAVERMLVERADEHDYLFVEGQGSIFHPAYSAVTCGILHGAMPDHLVLCHEAGREAIHGYESFSIPDPGRVADRYLDLAENVAPAELLGGALNTYELDDDEADAAIEAYEESIGVPAVDPVRDGAEELIEQL